MGRRKGSKLTHTKKNPLYSLLLTEPNSSCFEFHNPRKVNLENVSLNNGASVFHQKAVIVSSILTGYQTSGCRFEEWTLAVGTWPPTLPGSWLECQRSACERGTSPLKGGQDWSPQPAHRFPSACLPWASTYLFRKHLQGSGREMLSGSLKLRKELDSHFSLVVFTLKDLFFVKPCMKSVVFFLISPSSRNCATTTGFVLGGAQLLPLDFYEAPSLFPCMRMALMYSTCFLGGPVTSSRQACGFLPQPYLGAASVSLKTGLLLWMPPGPSFTPGLTALTEVFVFSSEVLSKAAQTFTFHRILWHSLNVAETFERCWKPDLGFGISDTEPFLSCLCVCFGIFFFTLS